MACRTYPGKREHLVPLCTSSLLPLASIELSNKRRLLMEVALFSSPELAGKIASTASKLEPKKRNVVFVCWKGGKQLSTLKKKSSLGLL